MLFKRRNTPPAPSTKPAVEKLLRDAHAGFEALRILRARVASSGIDMDKLPDDVALRAFALLGDHERVEQVARISPHLALLMDKGLIESTDVEALSTPTLRFFASIEELFDWLLDNSQRIAAGIVAWQSGERPIDRPIIHAPDQIIGIYSQEIRLKAYVSGAEWLLVRPDPIFRLANAMLRVPTDGPVTISDPKLPYHKKLMCDDGEIVLAAMAPSGTVSVHTIRVSTLSTLPEAT